MAKLLIEYDSNEKLEMKFEEAELADNIKLLQSLFKIADHIALEILSKDEKLGDSIDETVVGLCVSFLKSSERYEATKKTLNVPSPAVHPLVSFRSFKK